MNEELQAEVLDVSVVREQEAAAIDMQIATAKRFPREVSKAKERILELATVDPDTAAACFYEMPRGGKKIDGPGIRLAEIVAHSWGNLHAAARVVEVGKTHVTVQGVCWDLENNFKAMKEVKSKILYSDGRRYNDDMIITTTNAAASKAIRTLPPRE